MTIYFLLTCYYIVNEMLQSTSDNVIIANVHNAVVSCSCRYYFRVRTPPSRWRWLRRQVTTGHCSVSRVYLNTYRSVINNAPTFNISDNARANGRTTSKQTNRQTDIPTRSHETRCRGLSRIARTIC